MSNKYGISEEALERIRARDTACVYCRNPMTNPKSDARHGKHATIEHLNYLPPWNNPITVAICCGSCNSSRGKKKLLDWFRTPYCIEKNINEKTVAEPVNEYIHYVERFIDQCNWTFAKTMPDIPHEYTVRDTLSVDNKKVFDALNDGYIRKYGSTAPFGTRNYTYLTLGNHKYWIIENILNRAKIS